MFLLNEILYKPFETELNISEHIRCKGKYFDGELEIRTSRSLFDKFSANRKTRQIISKINVALFLVYLLAAFRFEY